jgi:hypothetical protein
MNPEIRSLLTDIKAAARIGHTESLWLALDGLLDLPQVAGNPQMNAAFLAQAVLPIGEALAHPRLQSHTIRHLGDEPQAALRAICAAALAMRHFSKGDVKIKDLKKLGQDPRQDVRQALSLALKQAGNSQPEQLWEFANAWLEEPSPRLQTAALSLLPDFGARALERLAEFDPNSDPEVRAALAETLTALAQTGETEKVLQQLNTWAAQGERHLWVITKTLSSSWSAGHASRALDVLECLGQTSGKHKQIRNAIKALERHGAQEEVQAKLNQWLTGKDENLKEIAKNL